MWHTHRGCSQWDIAELVTQILSRAPGCLVNPVLYQGDAGVMRERLRPGLFARYWTFVQYYWDTTSLFNQSLKLMYLVARPWTPALTSIDPLTPHFCLPTYLPAISMPVSQFFDPVYLTDIHWPFALNISMLQAYHCLNVPLAHRETRPLLWITSMARIFVSVMHKEGLSSAIECDWR